MKHMAGTEGFRLSFRGEDVAEPTTPSPRSTVWRPPAPHRAVDESRADLTFRVNSKKKAFLPPAWRPRAGRPPSGGKEIGGMAKRTLALCADDYGLSHGVSAGILKALTAGRLTAASVLTNGPRWPASGRELARAGVDADIGLHFNLTLGRPLSSMPRLAPSGEFPPVSKIVRAAWRRKLPLDEIRAELERQLDRFEAVMERAPDHLDGHQHVQALPGIREVVFDVLEQRRLAGKIWLRDSGDRSHRILLRGAHAKKAMIVRGLASGFRVEAKLRGFLTNDGFAGFSDFNVGRSYGEQFSTYLRARGRRHLVMCHPGHVDADLCAQDPVTVTREQELAFFLSAQFAEMLEARGLTLGRLSKV
jgi:chitin disaccharide deacetylase